MSKTRVLFLCTGNTARSQMAEAFLRTLAGDRFEAHSAGLDPSVINPMTTVAMAEKGIPLEGQRSKSVDEYLGRVHFGYLVTVCARAEESCPRVFPGVGRRLFWDLEDPASAAGTPQERLEAFRRVRDEIEARVRSLIAEVDAAQS